MNQMNEWTKSPDVNSLFRYSEVPVSHYSGVPNINVPIANIKLRDLSLPIQLNYHAGGVPVREVAGWTGLGWTLSAGGSITRVTRGYPDFFHNVNLNDSLLRSRIARAEQIGAKQEFASLYGQILHTAPEITSEYASQNNFWLKDTEYDVFYYNFLGQSGRFYFANDGSIFTVPYTDLKIEWKNKCFIITDTRGIQYSFTEPELMLQTYSPGQLSPNGTPIVNTFDGWFLTKIYQQTSGTQIDFIYNRYYDNQLYDPQYLLSRNEASGLQILLADMTFAMGAAVQSYPRPSYYIGKFSSIPITDKREIPVLDRILLNGQGEIKFHSSFDRVDQYKNKLDSIIIKNNNAIVQKTVFDYDYFNRNNTDMFYRRLKLKSVHINDQKYEFSYKEDQWGITLPRIVSKGVDYWGFYNGEDENTDLRPYYTFMCELGHPFYNLCSSALRNADHNFASIGTLNQITYPTGGKVLFEYEGNNFSSVAPAISETEDPYGNTYNGLSPFIDASKGVVLFTDNGGEYQEFPMKNQENNFVIHEDQTVTLTNRYGIAPDLSYEDYLQYFTPQSGYALDKLTELTLYKFNDVTKSFDQIWATSLAVPVDSFSNTMPEYMRLKIQKRKLDSLSLSLTKGSYKLTGFVYGHFMNASTLVRAVFDYRNSDNNQNAGGIRVKSITYKDHITDSSLVTRYTYGNILAPGTSSGILEAPMGNVYVSAQLGVPVTLGTDEGNYQTLYYYANADFGPTIPKGNVNGCLVGYSLVNEIYPDGSRKEYNFSSGDTSGFEDRYLESNLAWNKIRSRITKDRSWKRGSLLVEKTYNNKDSLLEKQEYKYDFMENIRGKKSVSMTFDWNHPYSYPHVNTLEQVFLPNFITVTDYIKTINEEKKTQYDENGNTIVTIKKYNYNLQDELRPANIKTKNSAGDTITSTFSYVANNHSQVVYDSMFKWNFTDPVIETSVYKNSKLLNTTRNIYSLYTSSQALPLSVETSILGGPMENEIRFQKYDAKGNVTQFTGKDGIVTTLIWGYNSHHIVAKVIGADSAAVFPLINNTIIQSPANEQQLRNELNNLRVGLNNKKCLITTYTHTPLIGITSETDTNNRTTYYEYDAHGRLKIIKDNNLNILKQFEYKYQIQAQ